MGPKEGSEGKTAGWRGSREKEKPLLLPFLMIAGLLLENRAGKGRTSQKSIREEPWACGPSRGCSSQIMWLTLTSLPAVSSGFRASDQHTTVSLLPTDEAKERHRNQ